MWIAIEPDQPGEPLEALGVDRNRTRQLEIAVLPQRRMRREGSDRQDAAPVLQARHDRASNRADYRVRGAIATDHEEERTFSLWRRNLGAERLRCRREPGARTVRYARRRQSAMRGIF